MDVNAVLFDILIVLVAAKVAAELADRIGIPAVVGEMSPGMLVGPSVFGLVETNEVLHTLGARRRRRDLVVISCTVCE